MERITLNAKKRSGKHTQGELNRMRKEDSVPAIVYGRGGESLPVIVDSRNMRQILATEAGLNAILELDINNGTAGAKETVMIKDVQRDILIQERLLHIDFIRISLTEKILVNVPLNYTGDSPGVKDGGVLQIIRREAEVHCLPTAIPDMLDVDVSALEIGENLLVKDIPLPEGVEMKLDPEDPVVQVLSPSMPEEEAAGEEAPEGDEEAAAGDGAGDGGNE